MLRNSLKNKIIFYLLLIVFIGGVIATFVTYWVTLDIFTKEAKDDLQVLTTKQADSINQYFSSSSNLVKTIAKQDETRKFLENKNPLTETEMTNWLSGYNLDQMYPAIFLLDSLGKVVASTDQSIVDQNFSLSDYFSDAMSGQNGIAVVLNSGQTIADYYFAYPVYNEQSEIIGVVTARRSPDVINNSIKADINSKKGEVMIVNDLGIVVFSDETNRLFKSLGYFSEEARAEIESKNLLPGIALTELPKYRIIREKLDEYEEPTTFGFYNEDLQKQEIVSITSISGTSLFLVAERNETEFVDSTIQIAKVLAVVVFLVAIFTALIVFILMSRFLRPLPQLKMVSEEYGAGKLDREIKIDTKDELGDLGKAFNEMASKLRRSKEEIDRKVEEQTREIREQRDLLQKQTHDLLKFQQAVESASDMIVITDPEGTILYANPATEKISGYSRKEAIGKKAGSKELWGGQMEKKYYQQIWHTIKTKKKPFIGDIKNKRKNGVAYDTQVSIAPVLDRDGKVIFFIGLERDITHEKEIDREKTEFVSLASHQLRTPLSTINWYTEMLLAGDAGKLTEDQKNYLTEIFQGNKRMVNLVHALLNVSRIELGTLAVEPEPTDLADISESVLEELEPQIKEKELKISKHYQKNLPKVKVDPKLMRVVLQNLFSNAVKYTHEKGSIKVNISQEEKEILITVQDTGYG
ncbi:MAG: signal transduction histidine kinase, partial [uncultured bacterium]